MQGGSQRRWTIPSPVPSFIGRDELLRTLRGQLTGHGSIALVPSSLSILASALYGSGGIGKTQLALAYAQKYRDDYDLGWWIPAESELSITTAFAQLAIELGMSTKLRPRELAVRANEILAERSRWLLIFDNASDPTGTVRFLPARGGHIIITSRNPSWHGIANQLQVDILSLDEAVELLVTRSGDFNRQAAATLATELGRLALALEQAASYSGQEFHAHRSPLAHYHEVFRVRRAELLARGQPLGYKGTVDTTYTIAIGQLRNSNPAAVALLEMCALLGPEEIPIHLLLGRPEHLPGLIAEAARDSLTRDEIVGSLFKAGLLVPDERRGDVARTHSVIQMVTLDHLAENIRQQRIEETVELLAAHFPDEGWLPDRWPLCAQLLSHARTVLSHAAAVQLTTPAASQLLVTVGQYLRGSRLALHEATKLHRRALAINRRLYQGDDPMVALSLLELGADLRRLGRLEEARDVDTEALEMYQRLYHRDHPAVARSLGSLAADLRRLGEANDALELDSRALVLHRQRYQGDHPNISRSLFGLAMDLRAIDELDRARELDTEVLKMRRRLYRGDHPAVAYSLCNLAVDLYVLDEDWDQARELDTEALQMHRQLYQGDYPDLATNLSNLANAFFRMEDFDQALDLDTQAMEMRRRLYGSHHPILAESLYNLAADMQAMRRVTRMKELLAQASAIDPRLTGTNPSEAARANRSGSEDVALFVLWTGRRVRALDD